MEYIIVLIKSNHHNFYSLSRTPPSGVHTFRRRNGHYSPSSPDYHPVPYTFRRRCNI